MWDGTYIYRQITHMKKRLRKLERRLNRLEDRWDVSREMMEYRGQLRRMKREMDALKQKERPTIVIEKLENQIAHLDVDALDGILNIGVASNSSEANPDDLQVGTESLKRLLQEKTEASSQVEKTNQEGSKGEED